MLIFVETSRIGAAVDGMADTSFFAAYPDWINFLMS